MLRFDLNGGDSRVRTGDLLLARQALSQLSYIPGSSSPLEFLVGLSGLEPPTLRLSVVRSSQLSYRPSSEEIPLYSLPASPKARTAPLLLLFLAIRFAGLARMGTLDASWKMLPLAARLPRPAPSKLNNVTTSFAPADQDLTARSFTA